MRRIALIALLVFPLAVFASSPEYAIGDTVIGPAPGDHVEKASASDGSGYLVVWRAVRGFQSSITAVRISAEGKLLDPTGFTIARGSVYFPQVVWTGEEYVALWMEFHSRWSIWAARVDRDGNTSGRREIIGNVELTGGRTNAVAIGSNVFIAYRQAQTLDVRAIVIDASLETLASTRLAPGHTDRAGLSVATNGDSVVVAWHIAGYQTTMPIQAVLEAMRVSAAGVPIDETPRSLGTATLVSIAGDGEGYVIVAYSGDFNRPWLSRGFDAALQPRSSGWNALPATNYFHSALLVWRGDHYAAITTYWERTEYRGRIIRINRNGEPLDAVEIDQMRISNYHGGLTATTDRQGSLLVVWAKLLTASPIGASSLAGRLIDQAGPSEDVLLSFSANRHRVPVVASSGAGYLAAWRDPDGTLRASRVSLSGVTLDGLGMQLSAPHPYDFTPRTAFAADHYIVAWREPGAVVLRYISPLTGLAPEVVYIDSDYGEGDLGLTVSNDAAYIAWTSNDRVQVTRIPHATRTAGAPLTVSPPGTEVSNAALSWNGSELLVVWNEMSGYVIQDPWIASLRQTVGARVTANVNLLDAAPFQITKELDTETGAPRIASNGNGWLVVWPTVSDIIFARRVTRDGRAEDDAPVRVASGAEPAVTWDGTRYGLAWNEQHLMLGFIAANGALALRDSVVVGDSSQDRFGITSTASGVAVAYTRASDAVGHGGVERTFLRVMAPSKKQRAVR